MKKLRDLIIFVIIVFVTTVIGASLSLGAEKKGGRKVQEVTFDGTDVDGQNRRPDGSYLVQKRGIDFMPLYNIKSQFDQNIKDSVDYLR